MAIQRLTSWGRVAHVDQDVLRLSSGFAALPEPSQAGASMLPRGNGRSYGDSALNPGGSVFQVLDLDRFVTFDPCNGVLRCEAGVLLSDILELVVPRGWFLPVVPGTSFVTVGGAIANDVHGKNHHRHGSFGHHVLRFELLRSDGSRRVCSPSEHGAWFAATIGGLGLTGLVTWAEIQLRRVAGPCMDVEVIKFRSLDEFMALCSASDQPYEYTVSWLDCAGIGRRLGRGLFSRGNHLAGGEGPLTRKRRRMPFTPPVSMVNGTSVHAFNTLYFHRMRGERRRARQHYRPFFFPLDAILEWNRMYGPNGFYQYQCVIPMANALPVMTELLDRVGRSGQGSFLAVLKQFGAIDSVGLLSFPSPGLTLALDFPNRGPATLALFDELDRHVLGAGGRLYPAKDGRMSAATFRAGYPNWSAMLEFIDPRFSSSFWRRVGAVI